MCIRDSNYAVICDLCGGDPKCVKACTDGKWNALQIIEKDDSYNFVLYSRTPEEVTRELAIQLYGEKGKEVV